MTTWVRQPQEQDGNYFFSGMFVVTTSVLQELSPQEIHFIYSDIQNAVKENNGIDYFQVYKNDTGRKLYFIDQLNKEMIESRKYEPEDNYCTLLFSNEY